MHPLSKRRTPTLLPAFRPASSAKNFVNLNPSEWPHLHIVAKIFPLIKDCIGIAIGVSAKLASGMRVAVHIQDLFELN